MKTILVFAILVAFATAAVVGTSNGKFICDFIHIMFSNLKKYFLDEVPKDNSLAKYKLIFNTLIALEDVLDDIIGALAKVSAEVEKLFNDICLVVHEVLANIGINLPCSSLI